MAYADDAQPSYREGIYCRRGRRDGCTAKISGAEQADGSYRRMVQSCGGRSARDALPERFTLPVRFIEIRKGFRVFGNAVWARDSGDSGVPENPKAFAYFDESNR